MNKTEVKKLVARLNKCANYGPDEISSLEWLQEAIRLMLEAATTLSAISARTK